MINQLIKLTGVALITGVLLLPMSSQADWAPWGSNNAWGNSNGFGNGVASGNGSGAVNFDMSFSGKTDMSGKGSGNSNQSYNASYNGNNTYSNNNAYYAAQLAPAAQMQARQQQMQIMIQQYQAQIEQLQQMINQELLRQASINAGLRINDAILVKHIQSFPDFQDDGVFSQTRYEQLLGDRAANFENNLRLGMLTAQIREGVIRSAVFTDYEQTQRTRLEEQQRLLSYLIT